MKIRLKRIMIAMVLLLLNKSHQKMKRKGSQLLIRVDLKTLFLKKDTTNAYRYVNKIPCKGSTFDENDEAQIYADREIQ